MQTAPFASAKSRIELKIKTSGVIFRGASAHHVQKNHSSSKTSSLLIVRRKCLSKMFAKKNRGVEKSNVGDHLKHIFPKFEAEWSHPRGVNGRSKFCKNSIFFHVFGIEK